MTNFDQSKHPRNAAGTTGGGQFAQKQNSAPEAALAPPEASDAERIAAVIERVDRRAKAVVEARHQAAVSQATITIEAIRDICAIRYPSGVSIEYTWDDESNDDPPLVPTAILDAEGNDLFDFENYDQELESLKAFESRYDALYCRQHVPNYRVDDDTVVIDLH